MFRYLDLLKHRSCVSLSNCLQHGVSSKDLTLLAVKFIIRPSSKPRYTWSRGCYVDRRRSQENWCKRQHRRFNLKKERLSSFYLLGYYINRGASLDSLSQNGSSYSFSVCSSGAARSHQINCTSMQWRNQARV
jgi:hypothetical protein